jgi:hypothetical protein
MALAAKVAQPNSIPAVNRLAGHSVSRTIKEETVGEIQTYSAIVNDRLGYRQEELSLDQRRARNRRDAPQAPNRRINTPMVATNTHTFAEAFATVLNQGGTGGAPMTGGGSTVSISKGIASYELTHDVIYGELAELGEELSLTV